MESVGKTPEVSFVPATVAVYLVKVNVKDETGKIVTQIFAVNSTKPTGSDLVNKSTLDKTTTEKGSRSPLPEVHPAVQADIPTLSTTKNPPPPHGQKSEQNSARILLRYLHRL